MYIDLSWFILYVLVFFKFMFILHITSYYLRHLQYAWIYTGSSVAFIFADYMNHRNWLCFLGDWSFSHKTRKNHQFLRPWPHAAAYDPPVWGCLRCLVMFFSETVISIVTFDRDIDMLLLNIYGYVCSIHVSVFLSSLTTCFLNHRWGNIYWINMDQKKHPPAFRGTASGWKFWSWRPLKEWSQPNLIPKKAHQNRQYTEGLKWSEVQSESLQMFCDWVQG